MPVYFEYALKASLCLAIIFLFYHLLLKQITWYTWNRFFLLIFSGFSFIVPFININVFVKTKQPELISFINFLPNIVHNKTSSGFINSNTTFNYWQTLSALYIFIGLILFVRLLIQILSIKKIKSKATPLTLDSEIEIYHVQKPVLPFSFLNSIFINKNNYSDHELQEIIDHERVHVQQKHTIDVLVSELICIINWYNPFAWFIKKAIRENLEFIADNAVLQKGFDRKNYQYLLLKVTGSVPSSIASSFKFTSLKSRIRMMNKTKTGRLHLLKFALLIPLVTLLLLAFRNKHEAENHASKEQNTVTKTYILSSLTYSVSDKKAEVAVKKEKENCLLRTGEALSLDKVFNEKTRLKSLLERNGYNNIGAHAITFMIDTTLGNNSFSIQVNINVAKDELSERKEEVGNNNKISFQNNDGEKLIEASTPVTRSGDINILNRDEVRKKQAIFNSELSSVE